MANRSTIAILPADRAPLKYVPQLDGLRAIAVIMVFLYHAFTVPLLWAGVDLFFILSGYLITGILLRDRDCLAFGPMLGKFYLRRAERILPAYILFMLLFVLCSHTQWAHIWGYYVSFLQNIPYAFNMIPYGPLVPLWSLAVEQQFYLVWPVVIYFLPARWLAPSMIGLLLAAPLLRAACTPLFSQPDAIYCLTPFRLDAMAAGALAALVLPRCDPARTIQIARLVMAGTCIAYVLLGIHPWFRRSANTAVFNGLAYSMNILVLGGLFVWATLSRNTWLTRVLSHPLLRGLGRISYMFYLLHLFVIQRMQLSLSRTTAAVAAFALTTALASLSWFAIERPILSLSASHRRAAPSNTTAAL